MNYPSSNGFETTHDYLVALERWHGEQLGAAIQRAERAEAALYRCGLAAHFGGEAYDTKRRGAREKLGFIERTAAAALAGTPAPAETPDIEQIADGVRYGFGAITDYWRGFNDGIDALVAALTGIPAPAHRADCASLRHVTWSSGYPDPPEPCDCGADPRSPGTPAPAETGIWTTGANGVPGIAATSFLIPPAETPDIDVERLAKAIHVTQHPAVEDCRAGLNMEPRPAWGGAQHCVLLAEAIAAEYRALATPDTDR